MRLRTLLPLAAALVAAACSSPPRATGPADSPVQLGFPSQTLEDIVYAQARFEVTEGIFGLDLVEEHGIVPIFLKVQLAGEGADDAQILISPERMNLRLYLADGTPLPPVPADTVANLVRGRQEQETFQQRKFRGDLLRKEPTFGYLFFQLTPRAAYEESSGATVVRTGDGPTRVLDVGDSLLAFDVTIRDSREPFYVGIQR